METSQEFCWKLFFKVLEAIVLHLSDILTIASKVETGSCSDIVPLPAACDGSVGASANPCKQLLLSYPVEIFIISNTFWKFADVFFQQKLLLIIFILKHCF